MGQRLQALDDSRPAPAHHPGLPPGMRKWDALRLVRELRGELGLSRSACEALQKIAAMTAEADWTDPERLPLCYRRQIDMADELGLTPRQFRTMEHRLEAAGLIERRVTGNGWRGRAGGSINALGVSGLSLAPLIVRVPELMQLAAQVEAERQDMAALRIEVRVAWRGLRRRLEAAPADTPDEAAALAPPRSEILHRMTAAALRELLARLEDAADRLSAEASDTPRTSGAPDPKFRCHTEDTTDPGMYPCSAGVHEGAAGEPADANVVLETAASEHCLRKQAAAGRARVKPDPVARLDLPLLRRIASAELRFYLDGLACRHLEDAERAIVFRLQELGIDRTAYEAAQGGHGLGSGAPRRRHHRQQPGPSRHADPESRRRIAGTHPAPPAGKPRPHGLRLGDPRARGRAVTVG